MQSWAGSPYDRVAVPKTVTARPPPRPPLLSIKEPICRQERRWSSLQPAVFFFKKKSHCVSQVEGPTGRDKFLCVWGGKS